jgi:hypothetical protein
MATDGERMSGLAHGANSAKTKAFSLTPYGQSYPQHYPQGCELGQPLSIREVARLIGCSTWTIRQQYLPRGLPHLRNSSHGKLTFFRNQVISWILQQQQRKGGR